MKVPEVSVLILGTNEKSYLKKCFSSLINQTYKSITVYYIDNNSTDGSIEYLHSLYPGVKIIRNKKNLGYARAHNLAMKAAFKNKTDYVLILNSDIEADKDLISNLIDCYDEKKSRSIKVGLIQPVILLEQQPKIINTIGNAHHYLGFGYCQDYGKRYRNIKNDLEIISASGTALFLSNEFYQKVGGFDNDFFIYNEDQDLSWRGRLYGYRHFLSAQAKLYHHYQFSRNPRKWYLSERNRWQMILKNYSLKTLVLLFPLLFATEILITIYALFNGWILAKLNAQFYILNNLRAILKKRKVVQQNRIIPDIEIIKKFDFKLRFDIFPKNYSFKILNIIFTYYYKYLLIFVR